jgi:hypothetical protein
LNNGDTEVTAQSNGTEITLLAQFSERERNMLIHGGFRRQLREDQEEEKPEAPGTEAPEAPGEYGSDEESGP